MAIEVSAPPSAMPQLQSLQKAMALPTVGAAVGQVGAIYTKIKGAHSLLDWALSTAEVSVQLAAATAAPFVAAPLAAGDARVAAVIDQLEKKVPLVTEQPQVIVATTKKAMLAKITPHMKKACATRAAAEERVKSLKELSWTKANVLLSTAYGQKALHTVDSGASYAMQLLDHYLPHVGPQEEHTGEVIPASNDPALHTMQTVGRLSAVAARRVWANLAYRVNELRNSGVELDVRRYVTALLAALHLAHVTNLQQQETEAHERLPEIISQERLPELLPSTVKSTLSSPLSTSTPKETEDSASTTANQDTTSPEPKSDHIEE